MFSNRRRLLDLFEKHNKIYDIVVCTRPDLIYGSKFNLEEFRDENTLYVPIGEDHYGLNDKFAAGSMKTIKTYLKLFDNMVDLIQECPSINPEVILSSHIRRSGLTVKRFGLTWRHQLGSYWYNS